LGCVAPDIAITQGIEVRPTPPIPCRSCRALARLRKRCARRRKCQQCHRLRSLAEARQLLHLGCVVSDIAITQGIEVRPTPPIPCRSCRAPARLRKQCFRRRKCQQCRRLRSFAGARQLPHLGCFASDIAITQGIEIRPTPPTPVGAVELQRGCESGVPGEEKCQQYRRLRSLAGARQLPHLGCVASDIAITQGIEIRPTPPTPCRSCRALARLRKRCLRRRKCQQYRRLRSLAGARHLPHLGCVASDIAITQGIEIRPTPQIPCGSCRALARLRKRCLRCRKCQQCRRLRSLAGARHLPHLGCVAPDIAITQGIEVRATPPTPCRSCRALARLRKRCPRRRKCQQYRRLRSLAKARH
jgi:uncharacterized protein YcbK (DUF882 family)